MGDHGAHGAPAAHGAEGGHGHGHGHSSAPPRGADESFSDYIARLPTKEKLMIFFVGVVVFIHLVAIILFVTTPSEPEELMRTIAVSVAHPTIYKLVHSHYHIIELRLVLPLVEDANVDRYLTTSLWVVDRTSGIGQQIGDPWTAHFSHGESKKTRHVFRGPDVVDLTVSRLQFLVTTTLTKKTNASLVDEGVDDLPDIPVAFEFRPIQMGAIGDYQIVFAAIILVLVYGVIVFELMHRTITAMIGSFLALGVESAVRERPDLAEIIHRIDFETCSLLFGMMVLVAIFSATGFFEWSAVQAYKLAHGDRWRLVVILCTFTAVASAFLDNVTTVLLLTPVTMELCKVIKVDPKPILIAEAIFSNIGGTATPVGDPPNVMIVNHPDVKANGVGFLNFTARLAPGSIFVSFFVMYMLKIMDKRRERKRLEDKEKKPAADGKASLIEGTTRSETFDAAAGTGEEITPVEGAAPAEAAPAAASSADHTPSEEELNKYQIHNKPLFYKSAIVITAVILMFFMQSLLHIDLLLSWIAILGCMALLVLSGEKDIEAILHKVEWATLLFFAALFILMEALNELGLMNWIGQMTANAIGKVDAGSRLMVALLLLLWVSAYASAFIDNIPYTAAMIPIVIQLASDPQVNLPVKPLLWALAYGTCLGGTGTLIGASANVVTAGLAEGRGVHISFMDYFYIGFPAMNVCMVTITFYLLIVHILLGIDTDMTVVHES